MKKRIAKNPYPIRADKEQMMADTGLPLDDINSKLKNVRKQLKKEKLKQEKMMATLEEVEEERGAGQYFLNIISTNNAIKLYNIMMKRDNYEEFINDQHIKPELSKEQLEIMTGSKPHDGPYFTKWLSCLATKQELLSVRDATITLHRNSQFYSVFNKQIIKTCSHLCDSLGCVLKDHLMVESHEMNISRRDCEGIILSIIPASTTSPPQIRKATPCRHGINCRDSHGDHFLYSCKKVQCIFLDESSVAFLNKNK
ncbi:unnamed protein product [Adineta steineri]|uniref:Zinc-binding loop region of homing endonuclease domain-containing protein n=1 Tax=Adineta steineri TaxID=433720 RepID=A0A819MWE4_9BILA|nr:unnamed protein product [Adineta steineri]CAF3986023.1 unnamed protein product [Adineta steineri]